MLPRKENGQPIPLQEYYQKGFFTQPEFFNSTISFWDYCKSRGVSIPNRDLAQVTQILGEERGMLRLKYRTGKPRVRIDADVLDQNLSFLKQTVGEVSKSHFPKRTADEISQARDQILRTGDGNGGLTRITFDEAYQLLFQYGVDYFKREGHPEDAEAHTQDLIIKILPYLDGEKGHFWHIHHFRTRFFKRALANTHSDIHRQQSRSASQLQKEVDKKKGSARKAPTVIIIPSSAHLTDQQNKLIEMKNQGLTYQQMAKLSGLPSVSAVKQRFVTIRAVIKKAKE
jgi:DNA-directed RNA polymerase specialized sigma24 family protein